MALPEPSVAAICRSVKEYVKANFQAGGSKVDFLVGAPAFATAGQGAVHRVNLFFDRFDPPGLFPDMLPGDPWRMRLHCLVTAFGVAEDNVTAGENDLRLLGEVIRLFHEAPILPALKVATETVRIEVVNQPLTLDDVNRLWATQKDVAYRPSVAYELALAPVLPRQPARGAPLVGAQGLELRLGADDGAAFAGTAAAPPFVPRRPDTRDPAWAPDACLVQGSRCVQVLSFAVGSPELAAFTPRVLVAGEPGTPVTLRWDAWDAQAGWRTMPPSVEAVVRAREIDPDAVPPDATASLALPFKDHAGEAVLHAVRRYRRAVDGAAGPELEVRSNPLLIVLRGAP